MPIAGVLVRTRPQHIDEIRDEIGHVPGAEVHSVTPDGKLVVTLEGDDRRAVADGLFVLSGLTRVLSAVMVYEQSDDESNGGSPV